MGGNNMWAHKQNCFDEIPFFLDLADDQEAHLISEKTSVLPKVYSTNRPNRHTLLSFAKNLLYFANRLLSFLPMYFCILPIPR